MSHWKKGIARLRKRWYVATLATISIIIALNGEIFGFLGIQPPFSQSIEYRIEQVGLVLFVVIALWSGIFIIPDDLKAELTNQSVTREEKTLDY